MDRRRVIKKRGMKVDMISSLPDDVLVHILSFLPLKSSSSSTSILSRRWLDLWKQSPNLILINYKLSSYYPSNLYVNWVNSALKSNKALSLQELTVDFLADDSHRHDVAKWLDFAFSKRVERLDFNWHCLFQPLLDHGHALLLDDVINLVPSSSIQSLRALCLRETKTSGDVIQFVLQNCPLLERLVFENAIITSDLEVVGPSLKHLDIRPHLDLRPDENVSIKVSAPNLTFLRIDYDTRKLFLENVPKLAHMIVCCRFDSTMTDFGTAASSQLKTLAISIHRLKASFSVPEMPKLKRLVIDDRSHIPSACIVPFPITCFLRASPCLEEFKVEITKLGLEVEVPKVDFMNLKRFKLSGFCGEAPRSDRIELVRYIVHNCVALEEIDISQCDGMESGRGYSANVYHEYGVRVATTEERRTFEKNMELQLPARIKLRLVNHSHNYIDRFAKGISNGSYNCYHEVRTIDER